jgi:prepilin-type N-terminal cleavage/methylation domain-containing protein
MIQKGIIKFLRAGRSESGFSLIEMMIAVTVISVGLVSVAGVSVYVSRTNSTSNILSVLATVAQDQADKLRLLTWDVVTEDSKLTVGGNINYGSSDNNHRATVTSASAGTINVSWKVAVGPGTIGDLRTITIKAVQVNPPSRFADGVTVSMIVCKN